MYLSHFQNYSPPYKVAQADALRWLAKAHSFSSSGVDEERFSKLLHRYGCGPDKIDARSSFLRDFSHQDWEQMQIFRPASETVGADARLAFYHEVLDQPVSSLYAAKERPDFDSWIHVTCTGYASPSVIQRLASVRGWGEAVECLHAYHMGCYAAFPALRMARGAASADILHTELCSLHFDPHNHEPEQLVIQSLFADGVIRYRCTRDRVKDAPSFRVEEMKEVIAPGSLRHMTWSASTHGFRMTLSREVPEAVQTAIAELIRPWQSAEAVYAIHPGGPRIIDAVKSALSLSEDQVFFSREILRQHGNMSSATLPHVWQSMLPQLKSGVPVISMAFGPGLTLSASLMRTE